MKFLLDMNLSPEWCETLRQAGWDAAHWSTLGAYNASDAAIMEYARQNNYVVLTHDLDFSAILAASHAGKPSVVQLRAQDVVPERLGPVVVQALNAHADALTEGAILTLDTERARIRILPLAG
jgi:predicted nuclease of predicted toxin-antitoxin system